MVTASYGSKCQWMFVRMIFSELQNILLPNLVLWCSIMSQSAMQNFFFFFFWGYLQGQGHTEGSYDQNMTFYIFWTVDSLATKLDCWYIIINQNVLWRRLDYCIWVKVTAKGQNVNVLSRWYLLNHQTLCFQTWYCDESWVRVSCKKIDLIFTRSRSLQELIWSKHDNFYISFELLILLLPNLVS